jgi:hypothetical protein
VTETSLPTTRQHYLPITVAHHYKSQKACRSGNKDLPKKRRIRDQDRTQFDSSRDS